MRKIQMPVAEIAVVNAVETKVSKNFVTELKNAFLMFPQKADMRFKQDRNGRLIIIVTVSYDQKTTQIFEGFGDVELIYAIVNAMGRNNEVLVEYLKTEHDVEIAAENENFVIEILRQYLEATTQCYIEKDWISPSGDRYRKVRFTPSFNMHIKFCLKATEEIDSMISEACKPEWMKKAEAKQQEAN